MFLSFVQSLRQAFQKVDFNNDGHISVTEFHRLINKFMLTMNKEQFELLLNVLNVGTGQNVNYNVFLQRFERKEDLKVGHPWLFSEYK